MLDYKDYVEVRKTIDELMEKSKNGAVIVVEGVKDRKSLRDLGVEGEIIVLTSCTDVVDKIRGKDVVILTDYDDRGNKIEKTLVKKFSSWGITPDVQIKRKIFRFVSKDITAVESLSKYLDKVEYELKNKKVL
ncbi:hypothetical protein DRP05_11145 [Archaeoglobales archaeon]|nr:MAG: hypothetical protein DRP05_11145 [Archaeoglobales archaeon]